MKLTPSPLLFLRTVLGGLIVMILFTYLWQGYHEDHWWSSGYILSLAIPVILTPCILWLAFVPSKFDLSDESLHIRFAFRQDHKIDWNELKFWGSGGESTFLLQFASRGTFQIALFAFPRSQRRQLIDFLRSRFPQRKATGWLGIWGFR